MVIWNSRYICGMNTGVYPCVTAHVGSLGTLSHIRTVQCGAMLGSLLLHVWHCNYAADSVGKLRKRYLECCAHAGTHGYVYVYPLLCEHPFGVVNIKLDFVVVDGLNTCTSASLRSLEDTISYTHTSASVC